MLVKLIASDMDGTFLDEKGSFDRERFEIILSQLEERKIPFVIASGNGIGRLLNIFKGFEDRVLFVADNGGHIYQGAQTLYRQALSIDLIRDVLDYLQEDVKKHCFMLAHDEKIYMAEGAGQPFSDGLAIQADQMKAFLNRIDYLPNIADFPKNEPFYKMGLWVPEDQVAQVVTAFNQAFHGELVAVTSGYGSIDLMPAGIHKAWGLRRIMEPMGIDPSQVMAFGDNDNDVEMLELAQYSYAVGNASPAVKAVAKYQIGHDEHSSVLTTIEEFLKTSKGANEDEGHKTNCQ